MCFKTVKLMAICNGPKGTIFTNAEFGWLQMVSEISIKRCASEDAGPCRWWIMRSHVGWRGEQNISYKGVETSP